MANQTLDLTAMFNAYMAQNQKTWEFNRDLSLGASETWGCGREGWYKKRGKEFGIEADEGDVDAPGWGAMERGNLIEEHFVVPALRKALPSQYTIHYEGDNQKTRVVGKSSATPDGLISGLTPGEPFVIKTLDKTIAIPDPYADCVMFEIKSIDPRTSLLEAKTKNIGQTHMQMGLIRETTEWRPHFAIILYVDASFLDKIDFFVVEFDEKIYQIGKQRANKIWATDNPLKMFPEGKVDGSCTYCHFKKACGEAILSNFPPDGGKKADPYQTATLEPLAKEFLEVKTRAEDSAEELATLKERLKEVLMEVGQKRMRGDGWRIAWSNVDGVKKLSKKKMVEAGLNPADYMEQGLPYDKLVVARVTPDGDEE